MEGLAILRSHNHHDVVQDTTAQAQWLKRKHVWVPSEKDGFAMASIESEDPNDGYVNVLLLETNERQRVSRDDCQKANPPKFDKCEDMASMSCLNEAAVLHNLRQRYFSNLIYTYSGLFCVVVNPYRRLPIYTDAVLELFKGKKRRDVPPHIFAVAEEAYRSMLQDREDQSILCTGESGAGKTENTKKVIQYLAHVAGARKSERNASFSAVDLNSSHNRVIGHLEEQLLQANPILEAFGNSKTVKNDNSSRFGKFIRVHFDTAGCISGANIEFYLLEKSRVLRQALAERSFHIFYQLLQGASPADRETYLLASSKDYRFLSNGHVSICDVDDSGEFARTIEAMGVMGFETREVQAVCRLLSAVLMHGNLEFARENKNSDQAVLLSDMPAQKICSLMGVNVVDFVRAFLKPKIKVQRDVVHRSQNEEQARFAVEAIAKACYERLFKWLVQRINLFLDRTRKNSTNFVGILDIAGFEIFDMNSFEQLCINYTNEKLQQFYNHTMFIKEQQEYMNEGLDWDMIDFGLNLKPTIDLIEKPMGILSTMDDVCLFPQGNDASFVDRLTRQHHSHAKFVVPEMRSKSDFAIVHYAGRVDYKADGWRVKNMDPLNDNVVELLQQSSDPFIAEIWRDVSDMCAMSVAENSETSAPFGPRVKKGLFRTVGQMYKEQLTRLMSTLQNTSPHFVRCIIPNYDKKPAILNAHLVLDQLRCNGVLEGIRISRQGYPNRVPFQEFRQRYERLLTPNAIPHGFMDGREAVKRMTAALEIDASLFRIGQSKIFFRTGVLAELEAQRDERLSEVILALQSRCRGMLSRRELNRKREQAAAIRILQRNGLAWMRLREWQWWRLLTKVKPLLEVTNKDEVIAEKEHILKATTDKLRRSEVFAFDLSRQIEELGQDKERLRAKLEMETGERAEALEQRAILLQQKADLESALREKAKKHATDSEQRKRLENEAHNMKQTLAHLETQLEEEERTRQRLVIEKVNIEQKMGEVDNMNKELETSIQRLLREKKALEEKAKEYADRCVDEEEKAKSLMKNKIRVEAQLADLQDDLQRETTYRANLEAQKRAVDVELRDEREKCSELRTQMVEMSEAAARKDNELASAITRLDDECTVRQRLERELLDAQRDLHEHEEDLQKERAARSKAEKNRRDMVEELEAYKLELEESNDKSALHVQMRAKREEDYNKLQKQMEELTKINDARLDEAKSKHLKQADALNNELEGLKRQRATLERSQAELTREQTELRAELASCQTAKGESERKRKALEAQLTDANARMNQLNEKSAEMAAKLSKTNDELEYLRNSRESETATTASLLKKIAELELQIAEMTTAAEEEVKNKATLSNKLKEVNAQLIETTELNETLSSKNERLERELAQSRQDTAEMKRKLEEESGEKVEEARRKQAKELLEATNRLAEMEATVERIDKAKKKCQQEAEDLSKELEDATTQLREAERKQRKFDQILSEERSNTARAQQERDSALQIIRDMETQNLVTLKEMENLREVVDVLEKEQKLLKLEVDDLASTKDDAGKSLFELEKMKRLLNEENSKLKEQVIELEDALQLAEDAKSRLEVNAQADRLKWERANEDRDKDDEDKRRMQQKQIRDMEEDLESERRQRTQAVAARKKAEQQFTQLQEEHDLASKQLEEATRQLRRAQLVAKEAQTEGAEARAAMDEALCAARDAEKKCRQVESELQRANDELVLMKTGRRKAETERDEALEELTALQQAGSFSGEEKKKLELRIEDLRTQLDEEQENGELISEKLKKTQTQLEHLTSEVTVERATSERLEMEKNSLARNVRDLKTQLGEAEASANARVRAQLATAEARLQMLEKTQEEDEQERKKLAHQLRRYEVKLSEANSALAEEQMKTEQTKEQMERTMTKLRSKTRQCDETDDELNRERSKLSQMRRELNDTSDQNEALTREIQTLKMRLTASERRMPRDSRIFGSTNSVNREEVQLRAAAMSETSDPRPSSRRSVFDDGSESGRS